MHKVFKVVLTFALPAFLFMLSSNANAATVRASNCSQASVQSAVNSAAKGDTVTVPAGSCTWSGGVTVSKGITVQGAGTSTTITSAGSSLFTINGNGSGSYRISNMKFIGSSTGGTDIIINGAWDSMRIDNINWNTGSTRAIYVGQSIIGDILFRGYSRPHEKILIDHITYRAGSSSAGRPFILIHGRGHLAWQEDDGFGTDNFVFIEDSSFDHTASMGYVTDTERAGRFVFRHNSVINAGLSMHDLGSTPYSRGNRAVEVYNNTLTCSAGASACSGRTGVQSTRGGTGLFFSNTIRGFGMYSWPMIYRVAYNNSYVGGGFCADTGTRRICQDTAWHCSAGNRRPCYDDNDCVGAGTCNRNYSCSTDADCGNYDGTKNICMQIDGNSDSGWPCRDQAGRGKDNYATGVQASSPIYWWNNTVDGVSNKPMLVASQYASYIQPGRDYCNGSPAALCGSKAAWQYTPYTYPHPLQDGEIPPAPPSGPQPPGNLRIGQ